MKLFNINVGIKLDNNKEVIERARVENSKLGYINTGLAASACNKVFKRELIEKYKFSEGKVNEDLFEEGINTSRKTMYPDWLSLDNQDTTIGKMYHKYGKVISSMGCVDGKEIITYKYKKTQNHLIKSDSVSNTCRILSLCS